MVEMNRKNLIFNDLESWKIFRKDLINYLRSELVYEEFLSIAPSVIFTEKWNSYNKQTIHIGYFENFGFPCDLYYPDSDNTPIVLICPGFGQRRNEKDIEEMVLSLLNSNIACIVPDYDSVGDRSDIDNVMQNTEMFTTCMSLLGYSNLGIRVTTNFACLKYIKQRNRFDISKTGITGLCQGAIVTWFTTAVCDEFKSTAPLCGATDYYAIGLEYCSTLGGWSGSSPYMNGILEHADIPAVISLAAPRPLLVQNNIIDRHWPYSGFARCKDFTQNIYELYNSKNAVRFQIENCPHAYSGNFISNIREWFVNTL